MNDPSSKNFDCVQSMRQIRDGLSAEIADMSYDQLVQWLREQPYTDSFLRELAEKATQQAHVEDRIRAR
jgi:phosphoribosyl-ATP pyrophosphohydrolase